jgi:hypothetical protein
MKSALFTLPVVQDANNGMIKYAQQQIANGKRDLKFINSAKTKKNLTMFGVLAMNVDGKFSAYVGFNQVYGDWENGVYTPGYTTPRLNATIRIRDLESFKDARLIRILEALDDMGLNVETQDYANNDSPNREFRFETDDYQLTIDAYVKSDSPFCKRVKVSETTRTIVDEEWKLECNE